ncbi:sigma-54 factor interaction domain-containing protein, partial [Pseudomonas viridiflava]
KSASMRQTYSMISKVLHSPYTVLLRGETGTGKEVVARAIHDFGPRRSQAFIVQNCAAFPENLLESELFGYCKGAFTGADRDRTGLFEAANGGTLLLDEIGDMPLSLQAKLLRVLQEGEI